MAAVRTRGTRPAAAANIVPAMRVGGGLVLALLAGASALAACGGTSSGGGNGATPHNGSKIAVVLDNTERADTARYELTSQFGGSGAGGTRESGVVDFGAHSGTMVESDIPPTTTTTTNTADAIGQALLDRMPQSVELRWIGDVQYTELRSSSPALRLLKHWTAVDFAKVQKSDPCLARVGSAMTSPLGNLQPTQVLQRARDEGGVLVRLGADEVRGVSTTHWLERVPLNSSTAFPCVPKGTPSDVPHPKLTGERTELWTDGQGRLRRMQSSAHYSEPSFDQTLTIEVWDYGTAVDVERPPASDTVDTTAAQIAIFRGTGSAPASAWHVATEGPELGGYTVYDARTSTGVRCYDVDAPGADWGGSVTEDGTPTHDGRPSQCDISADFVALTPVTLVSDSTPGHTLLVAAVPDAANSVTLVFADGSKQTPRIDPETRLITVSTSTPSRITKIVTSSDASEYTCSVQGGLTQTPPEILSHVPPGTLPPDLAIPISCF